MLKMNRNRREKYEKNTGFLLSLGLTDLHARRCGSKTNETTGSNDAQTESAAVSERVQQTMTQQQLRHPTKHIRSAFFSMCSTMHWMLPTKDFSAALDDLGIKYDADQQNAAGEASSCQTISETLVNDGDDLIFTIATPAAPVRSRCYLRYSDPADSRNRSGRIRSGRVKRCTGRKCNWYF